MATSDHRVYESEGKYYESWYYEASSNRISSSDGTRSREISQDEYLRLKRQYEKAEESMRKYYLFNKKFPENGARQERLHKQIWEQQCIIAKAEEEIKRLDKERENLRRKREAILSNPNFGKETLKLNGE